jgi:hypothetical protein
MNYMSPPETFSEAITLSDVQRRALVAAISEVREERRRVESPAFTGGKGIAKKRPAPAQKLSFIL